MNCPNCRSKLTAMNLKSIIVDHCPNCGGTFFDENEINRIGISDAHLLAKQKETEMISGEEKFCPKDRQSMIRLQNEAVPKHITLLYCKKCHGVFTYPDDLVHFKKAQTAKINYFKTWNIPMPNLHEVIVYSVILFISLTTLGSIYMLSQSKGPTPTQAREICKKFDITKTDRGFLVFCQTDMAYTSYARLKCASGRSINNINTSLSTSHLLISSDNCTNVQFVFSDGKSTIYTDEIYLPQ